MIIFVTYCDDGGDDGVGYETTEIGGGRGIKEHDRTLMSLCVVMTSVVNYGIVTPAVLVRPVGLFRVCFQ